VFVNAFSLGNEMGKSSFEALPPRTAAESEAEPSKVDHSVKSIFRRKHFFVKSPYLWGLLMDFGNAIEESEGRIGRPRRQMKALGHARWILFVYAGIFLRIRIITSQRLGLEGGRLRSSSSRVGVAEETPPAGTSIFEIQVTALRTVLRKLSLAQLS